MTKRSMRRAASSWPARARAMRWTTGYMPASRASMALRSKRTARSKMASSTGMGSIIVRFSVGQMISIDSLDDPRVAPYLNLKERDLAREGGRFIAEAELVVRRLLRSAYVTESVFAARERVERILPDVPEHVPVYVAERELVNKVLGFKFHSGIMACGVRGRSIGIDEIAPGWGDRPVTLMVLPEIGNTENMGALLRISAGFGASGVILGEKCCDPFYRQAVRVSMGTVFS